MGVKHDPVRTCSRGAPRNGPARIPRNIAVRAISAAEAIAIRLARGDRALILPQGQASAGRAARTRAGARSTSGPALRREAGPVVVRYRGAAVTQSHGEPGVAYVVADDTDSGFALRLTSDAFRGFKRDGWFFTKREFRRWRRRQRPVPRRGKLLSDCPDRHNGCNKLRMPVVEREVIRIPFISCALVLAVAACGAPRSGRRPCAATRPDCPTSSSSTERVGRAACRHAAGEAASCADRAHPGRASGALGPDARRLHARARRRQRAAGDHGDELRFYEFARGPGGGVQADANSISGNFAFTGEGQSWTKYEALKVDKSVWYAPKPTRARASAMRNAPKVLIVGAGRAPRRAAASSRSSSARTRTCDRRQPRRRPAPGQCRDRDPSARRKQRDVVERACQGRRQSRRQRPHATSNSH